MILLSFVPYLYIYINIVHICQYCTICTNIEPNISLVWFADDSSNFKLCYWLNAHLASACHRAQVMHFQCIQVKFRRDSWHWAAPGPRLALRLARAAAAAAAAAADSESDWVGHSGSGSKSCSKTQRRMPLAVHWQCIGSAYKTAGQLAPTESSCRPSATAALSAS